MTAQREETYNEFVGLLARHDLAIRRFVRSLMPGNAGVDDVVQETALECWKKFGDFAPARQENASEEFVRWACVIARYKAMSWQRDRSRDRLVFRESVIEQLAAGALERMDQQESERRAVKACLEELQDDHRRLVLSVHSPGESVARIAGETGESARRLYGRVNNLRKVVLQCVQQRLAAEVNHG